MSDYRFIDKDPIIDLIRSGIQQTGRSIDDISANAGIHPQTLKRWLFKDVKRPQNITVELVLLELGIKRLAIWIKTNATVRLSPERTLATLRKRSPKKKS